MIPWMVQRRIAAARAIQNRRDGGDVVVSITSSNNISSIGSNSSSGGVTNNTSSSVTNDRIIVRLDNDVAEVQPVEGDRVVILVYPMEEGASNAVTVTRGDQKRCSKGEYWNDNLIDLRIKFLVEEMPDTSSKKYMFLPVIFSLICLRIMAFTTL